MVFAIRVLIPSFQRLGRKTGKEFLEFLYSYFLITNWPGRNLEFQMMDNFPNLVSEKAEKPYFCCSCQNRVCGMHKVLLDTPQQFAKLLETGRSVPFTLNFFLGRSVIEFYVRYTFR